MDELLPKAALIELEKAQRDLLLGNDAKVKENSGWLKKTLAWCDENGINLGRRAGGHFYIESSAISAIENRLQLLGEASLAQLVKQLSDDRVNASQASANEKLASQLPTQHLVLSACTDLSLRLSQQSLFGLTDTPVQINLELDVLTIDLSRFDYLIVIENRDCFNAWHRYQIPSLLLRSLVIYRGHEKQHSKGCMTLKSRWFDEKGSHGQVYFGDFDIDGLAIAIDSKVAYQHLLLPTLDKLTSALKSLHFADDNAYRQRDLINRCPVEWQPLLDLLLTQQAGLRQQWMFDDELGIY
jgi:hypothetical protein